MIAANDLARLGSDHGPKVRVLLGDEVWAVVCPIPDRCSRGWSHAHPVYRVSDLYKINQTVHSPENEEAR